MNTLTEPTLMRAWSLVVAREQGGIRMENTSTILIVDDQSAGRETLEKLLVPQGYQVVHASNGVEALEKAALLRPDMILLDIMMPEMDGFEVCQRIRADPDLAEIPIVMVTALDDRDSRLRAIEAGADDFVSKPFDRAELRARVQTATRLNRYRRLLAERAKFAWVVNQTEDGFLLLDEGGNIRFANRQARLYLGLSQDEKSAPGPFLDLVKKQYSLESEEAWADWPQTNTSSERYLMRPASSTADVFWLEVNILETTSGVDQKYLVSLNDVTSNVLASSSMWSFHALVNHKLKTPLAVLVGYLSVITNDWANFSDLQIESFLSKIRKHALQLQDRTRKISGYIKTLQTGAGDHAQRCNVAAISTLISEVVTGLELEPIHITLDDVIHLRNKHLTLTCDELELSLHELLGNAVKFHPEHAPALEFEITEAAHGIRIQIRDDGLTLSPYQLARLWTPYFQAERYFTGQMPGMGLGLPLVAALIRKAGGTYHAHNRPEGQGIIIEINLPLIDSN